MKKISEKAQSVVLVERDYKGRYERFALTPEEFQREFPDVAIDLDWPLTESDAATLRPLVHMWFGPAMLGDEVWKDFFTDMEQGLPESDIESGNWAYIRPDLADELLPYVMEVADALRNCGVG